MNKEPPQATGGQGEHRTTAKIPEEHRKNSIQTLKEHRKLHTDTTRIWKPHTCVSWFELDDLHPDALTFAAMECFQKLF